MNQAVLADPHVAKIQKTLTFHEEVARLIQAYADKKGTTFQRVIQAAALQFFFSSTGGPDAEWLSAFVELEKGAGDPPLDLSRLPMKIHDKYAQTLERKLAAYRKRTNHNPEWAKKLEVWIADAHGTAGVWRCGIDLYGGGVEGTIERAIASDVEQDALSNRMDRLLSEPDTENNED